MTSGILAATIGDTLAAAARARGGATAYIDEHGSPVSWAQIDAAADRVACGLLALGFGKGDRIGLVAPNGIGWLQLFYGAARIGVAVVAMSVRYRDAELEYMLADSQARGLVIAAEADGYDLLAMADRLAAKLPRLGHVIPLEPVAGRETSLAALLATPVDAAKLAAARESVFPENLATVIYTSGTTGRPKGAGLTHASMLASAAAQAAHQQACDTDLLQLALPLNHVGGITCGVLTNLIGGGVIELVPVFKADLMLELFAQRPPTILTGVPTMLTLFIANPAWAAVNLDSVRLIVTGGSNVESGLLAQLRQRMPRAQIMNLYGLSESSGALVMTPHGCDEARLMSSIGRPLAGAQLRVVTREGSEAAVGEVGELWFRGLGVVPGYIGAAAQSDAFDADGWLHTGDLGEVDAEGYIRLRGRAKDMYIQGGFNVYPAEIEDFIGRHPKVLMVAGIGVPDRVLGEVGRYYVVPKPGSGLTEQEVLDHCRGRLADYKIPRQVVLRDELPLTPAGKIQKAALRAEGS
jgi:fatty-acyl-CoA synthase